MDFYCDLPELCSKGFNKQYLSFGSDNALAPTRRNAIMWNSDG